MARAITTFLMFDGVAEKAMNFYMSLFNNSDIKFIERYDAGEAGAEESIKKATFTLCGRNFMCSDTPVKHDFTFTPSISLYLDCDNEIELENVFKQLSDSGKVFMPLNDYEFSKKFGWVNDRFGVSWPLNLAA